MKSTLLGAALALGVALLVGCGGCGEDKKETTVSKETYIKVWTDLVANMAKKRTRLNDLQGILKKVNITEAEWKNAQIVYNGMPNEVREAYEKAMMPKGMKKLNPPSPSAPK